MKKLAVLLLLAACSNDDGGIRSLEPVIAVAPATLNFGEVGPPVSETKQIFVTNSGSADLVIDEVRLQGGAGGFAFDAPTPLTLGPNEEYALDVIFAPDTYQDYTGRVAFLSNDKEHPTITVPLIGRGVDLPYPDIEIRVGEVATQTVVVADGAIVPIGQSAEMSFDIWNVGDADLHLEAITLAAEDGSPVPEFVEVIGQSGNVIRPNEFATAVYIYNPADLDGDLGIVTIPSDDPDEPSTIVQLDGNGAIEPPIAVIDCPTEVLLTGPEIVPLSGAGSSDPAGYVPLQFSWEVLTRPSAADLSIEMDPDDTEEVDLYVDVAGTWAVQLRVLNTLGAISEPTICEFEAIPEDDLHVELSWDTAQADLDLHLVQGGATLWDVPEDCNFCNRTPNWGTNGDDDDPRLDIDDRAGDGPENINIFHPETGTYDVKVHYFAENGDGPLIATVHVWLDGAEVFTGSQVLTLDQVWSVGVADWPSGTFVPSGVVGTTPLNGCQD